MIFIQQTVETARKNSKGLNSYVQFELCADYYDVI